MNANLPCANFDINVAGLNHLIHFGVPITDADNVQMLTRVRQLGHGNAFSSVPGDFAAVQWGFKASAWAWASTTPPDTGSSTSIPVNSFERVFADYNGDGKVSAADFTVWRDNFGAVVDSGTSANGDRDTVIDKDDFRIWKLTYGLLVEPFPPASGTSFM